jgi:AcrR family transcriptional regulator
MPKLWVDTIETHRRTVRDAILDTTAALVTERGLASVTMSEIAERTGVGRATLYKYFPDVEAILVAWHARHVAHHLEHLVTVRDRYSAPRERLEAVLEAYALLSYERSRDHPVRAGHAPGHERNDHSHGRHAGEIAMVVHRTEHVARMQQRLNDFVADLLAKAQRAGKVRDDVPPKELARYCLHALGIASQLASEAAVRRLVGVTLAGLRSAR